MREMNQLSGGQKSLVALALIFAIQVGNIIGFIVSCQDSTSLCPALKDNNNNTAHINRDNFTRFGNKLPMKLYNRMQK